MIPEAFGPTATTTDRCRLLVLRLALKDGQFGPRRHPLGIQRTQIAVNAEFNVIADGHTDGLALRHVGCHLTERDVLKVEQHKQQFFTGF